MRRSLCALLLAVASVSAAEIEVETGSALARLSEAERQDALTETWKATPILLPDGKRTLGELVALCAAGGFAVRLDDGVDPTQAVEFPGFKGTGWEAVLQLATWFELDLRPGAEQTGEQWWAGGQEGHTVPWQSGAVVLVPAHGHSLPRQANGGLLVEIADATLRRVGDADTATLDLALRLRLEPRSDELAVTDARIAWTAVTVDGRTMAVHPAPNDAEQIGLLRIGDIAGEAPFVVLRGLARVAIHEPFVLDLELAPGDTAVVALGDQQARIGLLDRDQAQAAGKRAACVVVTYPGQLLQGPFEISVHDGEQTIATQGTAARHDFNADSEQVQYLAGLGAARHRINVRGLRRLGSVSQEVEASLDLGAFAALARPDTPPGTATRVVLPAGETTLATALAALRQSGNEVLLDLGVDTSITAILVAYDGPFWGAAVQVAQRFGLDLLPPAPPLAVEPSGRRRSGPSTTAQGDVRFAGGPARFGRRSEGLAPPMERFSACGPLLIEIVRSHGLTTRTLTGSHREQVVELRLRLEPLLTDAAVTDGTVWWASTAGDAHVRTGVPSGLAPPEEPLVAVTLTGLTPGATRLDGMVGFRLQERLQATATLRLGGSATVLLAEAPVTLSLGPVRDGEQMGLTLRYQRDRLERLEPVVSDAEGRVQEARGRSSRSSNRMVDEQWALPGLQNDRDYTIALSTQRLRAEPSLPITVHLGGVPGLPGGSDAEHPPSP